MNRAALAGAILGLTYLSTTDALAQGYAYGVDAQKKLWYFDLSTAGSTLIGDVSDSGTGVTAQALGMDGSGRLYATSSNGGLYAVSTVNAAATFIGPMGIGIVAGMDWDATNGRMLVSNFASTPSIYAVDLSTAGTTLVKSATSAATSIQTLAVRAGGSVIDVRYGSGLAGAFGDKHGTLDLTSGVLSSVAGIHSDVSAMDHGSNGSLYGLTKFGRLVSIDPSDGSSLDIGLVNGGVVFVGMASAVPEPTVGILMSLGIGVLLCLRKRGA